MLLSAQVYRWDFNVFDFAQSVKGKPLYNVTMALLQDQGLLVRMGCIATLSTLATVIRVCITHSIYGMQLFLVAASPGLRDCVLAAAAVLPPCLVCCLVCLLGSTCPGQHSLKHARH
jgi:hypothetical protein